MLFEDGGLMLALTIPLLWDTLQIKEIIFLTKIGILKNSIEKFHL
jgi:hypothetical protein